MTNVWTTVSVMAPKNNGWSECMDWCWDNCSHGWHYQGEGVFQFENSSEALFFRIRWS
jgi:hypothetical protein